MACSEVSGLKGNQILTKNSFDNIKIYAYLERFYEAPAETAGLFV
jgi:hypothetical protein